MKLIRSIPSRSFLVSEGDDVFGNHFVCYKFGSQKYLKIYFGKNAYKCYQGHDCF